MAGRVEMSYLSRESNKEIYVKNTKNRAAGVFKL
jgi:hypothetical protein